ncbi:MAG: universal stress protein [Planctomycetota bacterium]|nr:MAG: universal stress protein [Planctomycetota bacterium]
MEPIQKVLAAIDFSDTTMPVVNTILRLHYTFFPEFVLLHVIGTRIIENLQQTSSLSLEDAMEFAQKELEPLWKKILPLLDEAEVKYQRLFRRGIPHQMIAKTAAEESCDLILMGCHSHLGIAELFLGNTAKKIFQETNLPVIFVKPEE